MTKCMEVCVNVIGVRNIVVVTPYIIGESMCIFVRGWLMISTLHLACLRPS